MLLKYIDAILCPICKSSRLWKLDGDFNDERFANGNIKCPQDHVWNVTEDIFRLDQEKSDEEMQFLEHNLTGFPKEVGHKERGDFLMFFSEYVENLVKSSNEPLILIGSPILFVKYMPATERDIVIVNSSEGILRQIQEILVSKRMYKQVSAIRTENIEHLLPNAQVIYLFDNIPENLVKNEIALFTYRDADADILWENEDSIFMIKK